MEAVALKSHHFFSPTTLSGQYRFFLARNHLGADAGWKFCFIREPTVRLCGGDCSYETHARAQALWYESECGAAGCVKYRRARSERFTALRWRCRALNLNKMPPFSSRRRIFHRFLAFLFVRPGSARTAVSHFAAHSSDILSTKRPLTVYEIGTPRRYGTLLALYLCRSTATSTQRVSNPLLDCGK